MTPISDTSVILLLLCHLAADVGEKIKRYAEQNIAAAHQFLTEVSRAKDFAELMSLHAGFMQKQLSEFAQHAQRIGEAYTKSPASAVKGPGSNGPPRE